MRYAVLWNAKSGTMTIKDEGADSNNSATVTDKSIGTLVYGEFGEIPPHGAYPEPGEHLRNLARGLGVDVGAVTVKNATKNSRLDQFEVEGDPDLLKEGDPDTMASAKETSELGPDELITGEEDEVKVDANAAKKQREQLSATHALPAA